MIPAPRHPGEREPTTAPLKQIATTALFDMIPQQRRSSTVVTSPVSQTLPNPVLVARMAPRSTRRYTGVLAVVAGAGVAVVAILLIAIIAALF